MTERRKPTTRENLLTLLCVYVVGGLGRIGANLLERLGLPEWPAVFVTVATLPAAMFVTWLVWLWSGRAFALRGALAGFGCLPMAALGLAGLIAGAASRGTVFVLVIVTAAALVGAIALTLAGRKASGGATS